MSERSLGCITTDSRPREPEADETRQPLWLASLSPLPRECAPWLDTVRHQGAILAWANRRQHGTYAVDKKMARHHALARNHG
jgi:hypothetical protein